MSVASSSRPLPKPPLAAALLAVTALVGCLAAGAPPDEHRGDGAPAVLHEEEQRRAQGLLAAPDARPWTRRVLYFALLDRFENGDPARDAASGEAACNDALDPHAYQGGDLAGLHRRLDYLEDLGVDGLWISPLYRGVQRKQGENCGFPGYWVDFQIPYALELEPRYGDAATFDLVLDDAHARGMSVMLDMVVNHAGYGARLVSQRPHWFTDPSTCGQQGDPDLYCALAGLPDFDHRVPEVRDYLVEAHLQWLRRFSFDGIRMDTVKHVPPGSFAEWTAAMRDERPGMYVVGELLDEHGFDRFDRYLDAGFDGLFNFPLRRGLVDTFARGGSVDAAASRMQETISRFGAARAARLVNLLDNHDVPRFLEEIPPSLGGHEAQRRYHLALTALATLPGIPQLYYGNEIGMYGGHDPHNRRMMPDWAFDDDERTGSREGFLPEPGRVHAHVKRLLTVRRRVTALQDGGYRELWRQNGPGNNNVWAYARHDAHGAVVVAFNNGFLRTDGAVPLSVGGLFEDGERLVDVLGDAGVAPVVVEGGVLRLSLPPQSAVVLVSDEAPDPITEMVDVAFEVVADTTWGQNVYVTGSAGALGAWDLNAAVRMTPSGCRETRCRWSVDVAMRRGERAEYKFVKIDEGLRVGWETGQNRALTADDDGPGAAVFRSE